MSRLGGPALMLALAGALPAQVVSPEIREADVREIVTFLASDELAGRDTPSPGLDRAAEYIADRFERAGLQRVTGDDWYHRYSAPGLRFDPSAVKVSLEWRLGEDKQMLDLIAGEQIRLQRPGDVQRGEDLAAMLARSTDARAGRFMMAQAGPARAAIVVETAPDSPFWTRAGETREVLGPVRAWGHPVFMLAPDLLPQWANREQYSITFETDAPQRVDLRLHNVVGVLPGAELPDEYVVVSAHYDHIGLGLPIAGDAIYNGADDNASGTAAVILLAEVLARGPRPRRSLLFVCFSGEERGLLGSKAFAAEPPVPLTEIVAQLNVEMIGRPLPDAERCVWITGAHLSNFAAIAKPALGRAAIEVVGFEYAARLFFSSDNIPLARRGVVAHSINGGSVHEDYHRPTDEVEKLALPHMTAVICGLRELVLELANRDGHPAYNDEGRELLERLR